MKRLVAGIFSIVLLFLIGGSFMAARAADSPVGVLVLAHGGSHAHGEGGEHLSPWDQAVLDAAAPLKRRYVVEVAFGMADRHAVARAVNRLEEQGVRRIVAIPLFVSSHSPIIRHLRSLLGLARSGAEERYAPVPRHVPVTLGSTLDSHPLVGDILASRALELSRSPGGETVIIVGHGPSDPDENARWLDQMTLLADQVGRRGGFARVIPATLFDDAPPPIREKATRRLRMLVEEASGEGAVIVVPLLLARGGIESGIPSRLSGLSYRFSGKTLLPDARVTRWLFSEADRLSSQPVPTDAR